MSGKIFISIACFMDKDIVNTIEDCINKAKYPDNIVFGICFQYDNRDNFIKDYSEDPRFRISYVHFSDARGPTYARYICSELLQDEEYYLQIDCHSRFVKDWDVLAIECLNECNDERAIITIFPIPINKMDVIETYPLNHSIPVFHSLSMESIKLCSVRSSLKTPKKTYYLSAAFIFGKSQFIRDVKYDPYLEYGYQKIEQQFYAVRLFTYGWNLYMPSKHIVATTYNKSKHFDADNKRVYIPNDRKRQSKSWDRVLYYYGLKDKKDLDPIVQKHLDLYDLGTERSLDDFFQIQNDKGCLKKLLAGLEYKDREWTGHKTYNNTNNLFNPIIIESDIFKKSSSQNIDFEWNIKPTSKAKFHHYPQNSVVFIDNKKKFFKLLTKNKITKGIPKTFFDCNHLIDGKNYYLKYAGNNGGKNVFIYNKVEDIKQHLSRDNRPYIIQEEVENMLLINNRKFVLRIWIVMVSDKFYLTTNGCCIVHENEYTKDLDRKAHIDHDIFKIKYEFYNKMGFYKSSFPKIYKLTSNICKTIQKHMKFSNDCYQVIGMDIIFDKNNEPHILELNSWPNMNVPCGNYSTILKEFFNNFLYKIVLRKILNKKIMECQYFKEIR